MRAPSLAAIACALCLVAAWHGAVATRVWKPRCGQAGLFEHTHLDARGARVARYLAHSSGLRKRWMQGGARTRDPGLIRPVLYRLSYMHVERAMKRTLATSLYKFCRGISNGGRKLLLLRGPVFGSSKQRFDGKRMRKLPHVGACLMPRRYTELVVEHSALDRIQI